MGARLTRFTTAHPLVWFFVTVEMVAVLTR